MYLHGIICVNSSFWDAKIIFSSVPVTAAKTHQFSGKTFETACINLIGNHKTKKNSVTCECEVCTYETTTPLVVSF